MGHIRLILLALLLSAPLARAADFHQQFEARCMGCHGHSGPFVSQTLHIVDDRIVGPGGRPVAAFLTTHAGGLDPATLDLFLLNFRHQIDSGSLFRQKCLTCHDRAYEFTRLNLAIRDDRLVGRYSGRDVERFLQDHGRLNPTEQQVMLDTLRAFLAPPPGAAVDSMPPAR
ncbi:hypothetical protein [Actibacterium ureilyticum]|uniref:hypothetical protein n=1 Tax=Actibacterium ureilyticum TaxID=1590614 RepID=UPI000BAB1748|nr:hypothetical protein [Actibacterium ureilyticum]